MLHLEELLKFMPGRPVILRVLIVQALRPHGTLVMVMILKMLPKERLVECLHRGATLHLASRAIVSVNAVPFGHDVDSTTRAANLNQLIAFFTGAVIAGLGLGASPILHLLEGYRVHRRGEKIEDVSIGGCCDGDWPGCDTCSTAIRSPANPALDCIKH